MDKDAQSDEMARQFEEMKRRQEAIQKRVAHEDLGTVLASVDDEDLDAAILSYVASKIHDDMARPHEIEIVTGLPPGCQAFYTTLMVDLEVPNGGFNQYFWNRGEFAVDAVQGYRTIGAPKHAGLMEEAVALYLTEIETHKQFRSQNTMEAFSESYQHTALDELDDRYHDLGEDTNALRAKFVRQHPEAFVAQ